MFFNTDASLWSDTITELFSAFTTLFFPLNVWDHSEQMKNKSTQSDEAELDSN